MPKQERELITLDATKMLSSGQRTHDISGYTAPLFKVTQLNPPQKCKVSYGWVNNREAHFPLGSTGVLYYHTPAPGAPVLSGELRFKLCKDLALFARSPDLQSPDKTRPWSLNLYRMVMTPRYKSFIQLLIHDRLVSSTVVDAIVRLPRVICDRASRILYSLEQPFELDLAQIGVTFILVNLGHVLTVRVFLNARSGLRSSIFTGRIKARFELSTLPEHAAQGPTLVLRVLELLTPIECHLRGIKLDPRPGALLSKHDRGKYGPWSLKLKNALAPAFREFVGLPPLPEDKLPKKIGDRSTKNVFTLRPEEMEVMGQPICDISGRHAVTFRLRLQDGRERPVLIGYGNLIAGQKPFPPNSKGVLYYRRPSTGEPEMSGELRFRVCHDVAAFRDGSDLLAPDGMKPWSIPLYHIVKAPRMELLRNLIIQDGLVEQHVMEKIGKLPSAIQGYRPLYALDWPFVVNLSSRHLHLGLINPSMFELVEVPYIFRYGSRSIAVYADRCLLVLVCVATTHSEISGAGFVRARLELSTLPEHSGSPVLVLRILELLEPVQPLIPNPEDRIPMPQAGSLFHRLDSGHKPVPWVYPLNERASGDAFKRFIATCEKT
ncbi:unnamed protein product [Cyclocybe aegerita]|uniref:Uncharacterized protein n=1 Tax=Cyclocybe aegerita TaxID=1973307 RepID=A0A8S0XQV9_CYCAE|nr:unnamed protein product [Cyclocybe aegerita]